MLKKGEDAIAISIGSVVEGRITGITKYGAFVSIEAKSAEWCIYPKYRQGSLKK